MLEHELDENIPFITGWYKRTRNQREPKHKRYKLHHIYGKIERPQVPPLILFCLNCNGQRLAVLGCMFKEYVRLVCYLVK
jgi:hypothetical protein